ncbi:DUF1697 domain-containing protein [Candidatus Saccharibacteria bacterium]|nr:DUF1697 domain-containing protein [Candidatus Saccharibacteria bacterium]
MTSNSATTYLALLRGVNVGGKRLIKMPDLQAILTESGLDHVRTYIQSGNVIFSSNKSDTDSLTNQIHVAIEEKIGLDVDVIVFSKPEWVSVVNNAPDWWGLSKDWKHNLLVILKPFDMNETIRAIGELNSDIEAIQPGNGVIYQSMSVNLFGRTTTGKLSSSPIYKRMTVRNYNTVTKLLSLLD